MMTHRERAVRSSAGKEAKTPGLRQPIRRRRLDAVGLLLAGLILAAALIAVALASTAALAPKPKVPVVVPPMPHVDICHPNVCYLTQKGQDEYACDHACQWDAPLDAQNDTVINFELKFLKRPDIENDVPYMYLDSKGNVTVGIGHLVASKAAAESLPFYNATTGKKATKAEIDAAFDAVERMPKGLFPPSKYKQSPAIVLHESDIEAMALTQLNEATAELKIMFPDYENYPAKARAALLDMMYNLGPYNLKNEFPKFDAAIRAYNFDVAAAESGRNVQAVRNETISGWLTDAANWEVSALAKKALCGVQPPDVPPGSGPPILPAAKAAPTRPATGESGGH